MKQRILLVDDDEAMLDVLGLALRPQYDVLTARNGREALLLLNTTRVSVVVLDLMMPLMTGMELMAALRRLGIQVPTVVITAGDSGPVRAAAAAADACLTKPFTVDELVSTLRSLLLRGEPVASSAGPPRNPRP